MPHKYDASNLTPAEFLAWRKRMGWSRAYLSARIGLGINTIFNYEKGYRKDADTVVVIPKVVALACRAIEAGLDPIGGW